MTFRYKREITIVSAAILLCLSTFFVIKSVYFKDEKIDKPIKEVIKYYNKEDKLEKYAIATTKKITTTTTKMITTAPVVESIYEETPVEPVEEEVTVLPYIDAPIIEDDGSIIYDGMTITELTDKLNKSLNDYLTNTGYFFAKYTKDTGLDPYLSVAIVMLETGCKWKCSSLTKECNNIGGLKGGNSCNGGAYSRYETLEDGINGYLSILYNRYYLKGMDTAEKMHSTYAASPEWANKVNAYINEIKSK